MRDSLAAVIAQPLLGLFDGVFLGLFWIDDGFEEPFYRGELIRRQKIIRGT